MSKVFMAILGLTLAALVGIFIIFNDDSTTPETTANPLEVTAEDHIKGESNAKITLIEYGDFECPACASYLPMLQQLEKDFGKDLRIVFRHFPLTAIHPNAFAGSRAAIAAGKQGKFFAMHDLLYQNQTTWAPSNNALDHFRDYARQLNLNIDQFNSDYNNRATNDAITADVREGQNLGISATPTFFINGTRLEENPQTYDAFKTQIEDALGNS